MKTRDMLVDELLDLAFAEDIGDGDHTTLSTIPADEMGRQRLVVKEEGILAGVEVAAKVFEKLDPSLKMTVMIGDGAHVCPGDIAFTVEGPVRFPPHRGAHDAQHHATHERHRHYHGAISETARWAAHQGA